MALFGKLKSKKVEKRENDRKETGESLSYGGILKQEWLTEKSGRLARERKYVFLAESNSNKSEIKKAVEKSYGVKVESVNIVNQKGKSKRLGRSVGRTPAFKKAIVTLKEGYKIETITI